VTEFIALIESMDEMAKDFSKAVPLALSDAETDNGVLHRLRDMTGEMADKAERLIDVLEDEGADDNYIEAVEALQDIFLELHTAVGTRLAERRAL